MDHGDQEATGVTCWVFPEVFPKIGSLGFCRVSLSRQTQMKSVANNHGFCYLAVIPWQVPFSGQG